MKDDDRDFRQATAGDVATFLQQVARTLDSEPLARRDLANALRDISRFLGRHPTVGIREALRLKSVRGERDIRRTTPRLRFRVDVASLDREAVRQLIDDPQLTKEDLVDVAALRFGIPRSRLIRENRERVASAIRSSLDNEEALDIIGQEAARVGTGRNEKWR